MKKDISKTTKTEKQGNATRKQLRETKRNVAVLETAKKRIANRKTRRNREEQEVKEGQGKHVGDAAEQGPAAELKEGEGRGYTIGRARPPVGRLAKLL